MDSIKISYVNLGVCTDRQTGEIKPKLPKNDSQLGIVDFKQVWMNQTNLSPDAGKGTNGMIFPFSLPTFIPIEQMKEEGICSNGLVFVDIDCGVEARDIIMDKMEDINSKLGGTILTVAKTRKGLHVIFLSNPLTYNEYRMMVFTCITSFSYVVLKVCGIDLRKIDKALDACTYSIKQRLFLRYSPTIYWNDYPSIMGAGTNEGENVANEAWLKTIEGLKREYPELWKKVDNTSTSLSLPRGVRVCNYANLYAINPVEKHEYIEHHMRWRLFDSLCCIFVKDLTDTTELMKQWDRCCDLIEPVNHSTEWFKEEPGKNKWYSLWSGKQCQWYDEDLLAEFGYIVGDNHKRQWMHDTMPSTIDDLLGLK